MPDVANIVEFHRHSVELGNWVFVVFSILALIGLRDLVSFFRKK